MTKAHLLLIVLGLSCSTFADSWLVGGQPVSPFELWAGNDLSIDPETGVLKVANGIDMSDNPNARILLDHNATNDNEVVNYRTATNLIAQTAGGGAPAGDYVAQQSGEATNFTSHGITTFEGGQNGNFATIYNDDGYTALDIDNLYLDRFYLNQSADINLEFFKWSRGLLTDSDENTLIDPLGRILSGLWKVNNDAESGDEIVNYRTATNLIALSGSSNPFNQDLNTSDSPSFENVTFGSGNFEDGFQSTATGFRINDMSSFDVINIAAHRLFDRFNDELALTWTLGAGGRNLLGRWSIIFDATSDQEIVNYRVLTNKIAQAASGGDNLGNHTATANLNLGNTNALTGVKEISFWDAGNGLATAFVFENWFKFVGGGFGFQASKLKADDFLYAGGNNTQVTMADNETIIKGEDLLLLESRYQAILRSVSDGDTIIESGQPSDNERGEIFITSKHDGDTLGGRITIKAEDPPSPGTGGQIKFDGDVTITNGSFIVIGSTTIDGSTNDEFIVDFSSLPSHPARFYRDSSSGFTSLEIKAAKVENSLTIGYNGGGNLNFDGEFLVIGGNGSVIADSNEDPAIDVENRDLLGNWRLNGDPIHIGGTVSVGGSTKQVPAALPANPVIQFTFAESVGVLAQIELLSSSLTNFTYQIRTGSGIVTNGWAVNWTAHASTP